MSDATIPKHYSPADVEAKWRAIWERDGYFQADASASSVPYTITLPPPNVTGSLHMGHALGSTIQDALIRWRRMNGDNAMWMPGTDHAGIATQMLVERQLQRTAKAQSRQELGREAFLDARVGVESGAMAIASKTQENHHGVLARLAARALYHG